MLRAEYLPEAKDALDLARKFDLLLDLAIRGESLAAPPTGPASSESATGH